MRRPLPSAAETLRILASRRSRPPRKAPPPAGKSLSPLIRELDARFGQGAGGLQARWAEIVGEQTARRTEPVKLTKARGGGGATLEIKVEGAAALAVQHQAADILERVNVFLGAGAVDKLRVVQGPVRKTGASSTKPKPARPRPPAPLDAAREAELARSAATAPDALRDALVRLGRGALRDGD